MCSIPPHHKLPVREPHQLVYLHAHLHVPVPAAAKHDAAGHGEHPHVHEGAELAAVSEE